MFKPLVLGVGLVVGIEAMASSGPLRWVSPLGVCPDQVALHANSPAILLSALSKVYSASVAIDFFIPHGDLWEVGLPLRQYQPAPDKDLRTDGVSVRYNATVLTDIGGAEGTGLKLLPTPYPRVLYSEYGRGKGEPRFPKKLANLLKQEMDRELALARALGLGLHVLLVDVPPAQPWKMLQRQAQSEDPSLRSVLHFNPEQVQFLSVQDESGTRWGGVTLSFGNIELVSLGKKRTIPFGLSVEGASQIARAWKTTIRQARDTRKPIQVFWTDLPELSLVLPIPDANGDTDLETTASFRVGIASSENAAIEVIQNAVRPGPRNN